MRIDIRLIRLSALVAIAAGGCTPPPQQPLAPLPCPAMDFSPAGPAAPAPAEAATATSVPPRQADWAVRPARPWRHIVIHHSATDRGSAEQFDLAHRRRGFDELGYHFVITNGDGGPDGAVQVGPRWRRQKWGAHCGGTPNNEYNDYGIGVCVVGDFRSRLPSPRQLASLERLVRYLCAVYDIPPRRVIGHGEAPGAATVCPGAALSEYIHFTLQPSLADDAGS